MDRRAVTFPNLERLPSVRVIRSAWRRLTGGREVRDSARRTLVACSGGADSTALVLSLCKFSDAVVVGHVLHDLRASGLARADRDAVADLARRCGLEFLTASVRVRSKPGNAEGNARKARYEALVRLARAAGCEYVATAHHADDQIETVLMRLMRGAGPRGLSGIRPIRASGRATIIRPMLEVARRDALAICDAAGVTWREDHTNRDTTRLRAAIRARVLPILLELSPRLGQRLTRTTRAMCDAADALDAVAGVVLRQSSRTKVGLTLPTRAVEHLRPTEIIAVLRAGAAAAGGARHADAWGGRTLHAAADLLRAGAGHAREFQLKGVRVRITGAAITWRALTPPPVGGRVRPASTRGSRAAARSGRRSRRP